MIVLMGSRWGRTPGHLPSRDWAEENASPWAAQAGHISGRPSALLGPVGPLSALLESPFAHPGVVP
jgi:hypothetical protein